VISDSLLRLKQTAKERLAFIRSLIRPDLGSHNRITLRRAGCESSGSLLHSSVADQHSKLLSRDFHNRFQEVPFVDQGQLRFLTLLHSVTALDKDAALRAVARMDHCIHIALEETGAWCLGAIEVEIVSLAMLRRIRSLKDDESRKLNVLEKLSEISDAQLDCGVLIHFHGVVDLSNSLLEEEKFRSRLAGVSDWQRSPYQIQLKRFFQNRPLHANLRQIASYITKGGNEELRYNSGFGRDLPDDLDAKIWRSGTGRADQGGDTLTDERALTIAEISLLDEIWLELMSKRHDQRGYLIQIG
jgi:hypothetical protein